MPFLPLKNIIFEALSTDVKFAASVQLYSFNHAEIQVVKV